jgi:hypothetical protein
MLVWFVVAAIVGVALVFDSPSMDHRFVVLGAVLPVGEGLVGGPWVLHTPILGVLLLAAVMLGARGRRLTQRRWLGVPIGMLAHLVLDGTWAETGLFWWPFAGAGALGSGPLPEFGRGWGGVLLEALGVAMGLWAWRRFGLADPARRTAFLRCGRLDPVRSR